jgi:hypothetical protein
VEVYRVVAGAAPTRVVDAVGKDDNLAFAYANPTGKKYLLVFAADEHQHVFWYFPAWTRPEEDPAAVPITPSTDLVELKESVSQAFDGKELVLYTVFTDDALHAREVERKVAQARPMATSLGFTAAYETSRHLEVR